MEEKKKIITLSMIKNEEDIVESFVRYTMNFASKMYFIDNGCTDRSIEILKLLQNEGFDIVIYNESNIYYEQYLLENKYLRMIFQNETFDFVIPLDVDEFLAAEEDLPKAVKRLSEDKISIINWKTYCLSDSDNEIDFFIDDISLMRINEKRIYTKVIIPYSVLKDKMVYLTMGHHDVESDDDIEREYLNDIYIAHFPVRSKEQIQLKIYQGALVQLLSSYHCIVASHWRQMFHEMKTGGFDLVKYSKEYALIEESAQDVDFIEKKFDYSWCKTDIHPKYKVNEKIDVLKAIYAMAEMLCVKSIINTSEKDNKKIRLAVYGTGNTSKNLFSFIKFSEIEIICYIDSNPELEFSSFNGKLVVGPKQLKFLDFDKVLIASVHYDEILDILISEGIPKGKIVNRFDLLEKEIENINL